MKITIELDFIGKDGTQIFDELDDAKRVVDGILSVMSDAKIEVVQTLKPTMQIGTPLPPYPPGVRGMTGSISSEGDTYILHNHEDSDLQRRIGEAIDNFKNAEKRHYGYL